jgi:uncharacterized RDD family membrane protein YckC
MSRLAARATGAVVDVVDPDVVVSKIDVDAFMERVDVNALLDRVDINALLDRVDVDRLMARVDIEAIVDRIDVKEVVARSGIPDVVMESTGALAGSVLDVFRRTLVAVDSVLGRFFYRLTGRNPSDRPVAPPDLETETGLGEKGRGRVTGHYAGPVTRLTAFAADIFIVWALFALMVLGISFVIELFSSVDLAESIEQHVSGILAISLWSFVYFWFSWAVAGKTLGMGLLGLRVVSREGGPVTGRGALVRILVFPFSFLLLGLGFLGILFSRERRALHDAAAGTAVTYDWGDRPAEMPAPLTSWLDRHREEVEADT